MVDSKKEVEISVSPECKEAIDAALLGNSFLKQAKASDDYRKDNPPAGVGGTVAEGTFSRDPAELEKRARERAGMVIEAVLDSHPNCTPADLQDSSGISRFPKAPHIKIKVESPGGQAR